MKTGTKTHVQISGEAQRTAQPLTLLIAALFFVLGWASTARAAAEITLDKADYMPGEIVQITGTGFSPGEEVSMTVIHSDGTPSWDELFGYQNHGPWTNTCDSLGNLSSTWTVCEDCLGETLLLEAVGPLSSASVTFTDSAGSYGIKWYAADPEPNRAPYLPTYLKLLPASLTCPAPSGEVGRAADPLADAVAYASPPIPSNLDAVTSLMPKDLALCQVVPFILEITVTGATTPENGVITVYPEWLAKTTSGQDFGFDPAWGVYCAFVDTADPATTDPDHNAKVDLYSSVTLGPGGK